MEKDAKFESDAGVFSVFEFSALVRGFTFFSFCFVVLLRDAIWRLMLIKTFLKFKRFEREKKVRLVPSGEDEPAAAVKRLPARSQVLVVGSISASPTARLLRAYDDDDDDDEDDDI